MNRFIVVVVLLAAALFSVTPDLFDRDRPLYMIETIWFDLIFPEESTPAALYCASFADDLYVEVTALLGTQPRHRLPVVITPDHEWINGYFTNFPFLRIVLYQATTDMDSTLGFFKDDLRSLFMHELTHAVSLTIRGPVQEALITVFGSPLGLSMYTTPLNFVEGVTVSFESRGGFGRTTDPLAGALIRQDLLEGKYRNFYQTMGTWDRYPGRTLYYIYGGYFSQYLQERFGMEKYVQLWQRFGSGMLIRPLDDFLFIQGHFRKVYGISLREAWAEFGEAMKPQMEVSGNGPMITDLSSINTLAAGGSRLFWADSAKGGVFVLDTTSSQSRQLFSTGTLVSRLHSDEKGSRLLVSSTGYEGGYARLSIHEWEETSGTLQRLPYSGLRDASYLPATTELDGKPLPFLAIQARGYETSLVIVQDGSIQPLLTGSQRISYASPVAGADGWIHVLAKEDGKVSVLRLRLEDRNVMGLQRLLLPDGLDWIRYLSLVDGILRFSWDDTAFYRLIELEGSVLRYQTVPTSGGVHQAVGASESVYHLGHFSDGTALCSLPTDRSQLGFLEATARWEPAEELLNTPSVYNPLEVLADPLRYSSLPWFVPRFWHPLLAGDIDGLTLAGATLYLADPIERISGYLSGGWNPRTGTPVYGAGLDLDLTPWLLRFTLWDEFMTAPSELNPDRTVRQGSTGFSMATTVLPFEGGSVEFGFSTTLQGWTESLEEAARYGAWDLGLSHTSLYVLWQDLRQVFGMPGLREGYSLGASVRGLGTIWPALDSPLFGFEVQAAAASGFLGLELAGYAALSLSEGLQYGPAGASMQTTELGEVSIRTYPLYTEFEAAPAGIWHLQAEVSLRPFSFKVQQAAGPVYTRRLELRTGSRAVMTGGTWKIDLHPGAAEAGSGNLELDWSLFTRLELAFSPTIGVLALARPVAWLELWFRPLDETWGLGYVRELSF